MKPRILIIDDDIVYTQQLQLDANSFNFEICISDNFEDGFKLLETDRKIKAVILDDKCVLKHGETPGTGKSNFIILSLNKLRDIYHEKNRNLIFCVNAEVPGDLSSELDGVARLFQKRIHHAEMFEFIKEEVKKLPETEIFKQYPDLFSEIDLVFDADHQQILFDVLRKMKHSEKTTIIKNLGLIRLLEETIILKCYNKLLCHNCLSIREIGETMKVTLLALRDKKFLPDLLYSSALRIYSICSEYGNHNTADVRYFPGKYELQGIVFSLFEIIIWAEKKLK